MRHQERSCVSSFREGEFDAMQMNRLITGAAVVVVTAAVGGALLAQHVPATKPASPVARAEAKPASSPAMAQAEATVAKFRDLIRPQPREYATNIAKIAWERDPWKAAVKAGKEGKPVIAYGVHSAGVTCGYG
jgi:hypothetical protein